MLAVVPVCPRDVGLAVANLQLCRAWGATSHSFLLLSQQGECEGEVKELLDLAAASFAHVNHHRYPACPYGQAWPRLHNWAWQQAALYVMNHYGFPWLWWEPDAVPVVQGWLDQLEAAYRAGRKPFGGFIQRPNEHQKYTYMAGVGIYPPDAPRRMVQAIRATGSPFDVAGAVFDQIMGQVANLSHLIRHNYTQNGGGNSPSHEGLQGMLDSGLLLYHRCTDGILQKMLAGKLRPASPVCQHSFFVNNTRRLPFDPVQNVLVQLGRMGDILNLLPLLQMMERVGFAPGGIVVQSKYVPAMQRCGYIKVYPYAGHVNDRQKVVEIVKQGGKTPIVTQLFSDAGVDKPRTAHYNSDAWLNASALQWFNKLPLEFDRRNWEEEKRLVKQHLVPGKRNVVVNLAGGESSPFSGHERIYRALQRQLPDYHFVDLNSIPLPCFADQLGLLDAADACITIDTSTLHLLQASHCPYVALLSDRQPRPWKSSLVRRKAVASWGYRSVLTGNLIEACRNAAESAKPVGKILHSVNLRHTDDPRIAAACNSWHRLYAAGQMMERSVWFLPRNARDLLRDRRPLPFLKDVLGCSLHDEDEDDDILLFTNDDIIILPALLEDIRSKMRFADCLSGMRQDVDELPQELPERAREGRRNSGRDIFCFRVSWLRSNWHRVPDCLLGASDWDHALAMLIRGEQSITTCYYNFSALFPECELPLGTALHVRHTPTWADKDNVDDAPSQLYNRRVVRCWMRKHAPHILHPWFFRL